MSPQSEHRSPRLLRLLPLFLLLVAAGIRVGHLVELARDPFLDRPIMDAEYHDLWARSILAGQPFVSPVFFRAPLYPFFLAGVYEAVGTGPWGIRIVQMAIGLASLALLYRLGRRVFGATAATLALFLAVLHDLTPYYEGELLLPVLLVFFGLAAMERAVAAIGSRRLRDAAAAGLLFGLFAITRPNALAVVPPLAILIGLRVGRPRAGVLLALASLPLPLAVTAVNGIRGGDPVFIASQGGVNFYLGNNHASNGWSAVAPGMRLDWWGSYEDGMRIPQQAIGRALLPSEVSTWWTRRALDEIGGDPGWWLRHLARKCYLWFGAEELSNNREYAFWKTRLPVIDALPVRYAVLAPLAILGAFLLPWRRTAPFVLFIVPYALSFILFFVTSRYRQATVPFLCLLAGAALAHLGALAAGKRNGRRLAVGLAGLALLVALLSSGIAPVLQPTFAISYMEIGRRELERGRWADAAAAFRDALRYEPGNLDARHDLGIALRDGGDPQAALVELETVVRARDDATSWNNLALTLQSMGRRADAEEAYRTAIARDPSSGYSWLNSAGLAAQAGDTTLALERLEKGAALEPESPAILYNRGIWLVALGRREEGRQALEACLRLAPNLNEARAALQRMDAEDGRRE